MNNTNGFLISDDKELLQIDSVTELLHTTHWARNRSESIILESIKNSICFGVYFENKQIGFARCVTDYCTVYWLCDVIIDEKYRGQGLGKALIHHIVEHKDLKSLMGILSSRDAKGLYEKYGFKLSTNGFMLKSKPRISKKKQQ
jgi:GNAT superfamily N-acetyltransferase